MKVLIAQLTLKIQSGRYHKTQYNALCIKIGIDVVLKGD